MLNDIQWERLTLKNSSSYKHLSETYKYHKIYIWNFWFIVVPKDNNLEVIKYYSDEKYLNQELKNHTLLESEWIAVPKKYKQSIEVLGNTEFYSVKYENIRKYNSRAKSIQKLWAENIWKLLSDLHKINFKDWKTLLHANLDKSNFFITENNTLWLFDLVSMIYSDIEYEFAIIYLNSGYDDLFITEILNNYIFNTNFDKVKMYKYTLLKISENIKYSVSINSLEKNKFKIDLIKIKQKIYGK